MYMLWQIWGAPKYHSYSSRWGPGWSHQSAGPLWGNGHDHRQQFIRRPKGEDCGWGNKPQNETLWLCCM